MTKAPKIKGPLFECLGIHKRFGAKVVLKGIDLEIHPGQHIGLVGNNGEGKSTLIRIMLGLLRPDSGTLVLRGDPLGVTRDRAQKLSFGYLPETVNFYPNLTGGETLRFLARLKGASPKTCGELLERVGLAEAVGERVRNYSKGMRQRLGLAQALIGAPELLLLDEPTNGLDPYGIREFYSIVEGLQERNVAIVTASHLLAEIEPRLDRLMLLKDGRFQVSGTLSSLLEAAGLPIRIRCVFRKQPGSIAALLEQLGATPSPNGHVHAYEILCPEGEKVEVLSRLMEHGEEIDTFSIKEPGLEEIFHHYQQPGAAAHGGGDSPADASPDHREDAS